jgi:5'(3')-deoxyribonucleotidase
MKYLNLLQTMPKLALTSHHYKMKNNKPIVAIDLDDVLSHTAEGWVAYSNKTWGMSLLPDDYDENWVRVWGVAYQEALKRREIVYRSGIIAKFKHHDDAKLVLTKLAGQYRLFVVTSRLKIAKEETFKWLQNHFGNLFEDIRFSGFYDNSGLDAINMTKADILKEIGASYLIDDQPKHCLAAADAGITAILFGEHRWSRVNKLPPGVVRIKSWLEVEKYFDAKN